MIRLEDFTACGAHQQGHFLLSSGLHSGDYMQCALFLARPDRAEKTGRQLATKLNADDKITVVANADSAIAVTGDMSFQHTDEARFDIEAARVFVDVRPLRGLSDG